MELYPSQPASHIATAFGGILDVNELWVWIKNGRITFLIVKSMSFDWDHALLKDFFLD